MNVTINDNNLTTVKYYFDRKMYIKSLTMLKDLPKTPNSRKMEILIYIELLQFHKAASLINKSDTYLSFCLNFKQRKYIEAFVLSQLIFCRRENNHQPQIGFFKNLNLASLPVLTFIINNAFEITRHLPVSKLYRGIISYYLEQYSKALTIFDELKNSYPVCYLFIAQIYENNKDYDLAIINYRDYYVFSNVIIANTVITNDNIITREELYFILALVWQKKGNDYYATYYLNKNLEQEDNALYHYHLGKIYFNREEYYASLSYLLIANRAGYNTNLEVGEAYFLLGKYVDAITYYLKSFNNDNNITACIMLVKSYLLLKKPYFAKIFFNYIVHKIDAKVIDSYYSFIEIAVLATNLNQHHLAREYYNRALSYKNRDIEPFDRFIKLHLTLNCSLIGKKLFQNLNNQQTNLYSKKVILARKQYANGYNILKSIQSKSNVLIKTEHRYFYLAKSYPKLNYKETILLKRATEWFNLAIDSYQGHLLAYYYRALCNLLLSNEGLVLIDINKIQLYDSYSCLLFLSLYYIKNDLYNGVKKVRSFFDYYFYDSNYWLVLSIAYKSINDFTSSEYCLRRYNKLNK